MANEWFCKLAGTEIGPLSPQQLKAMAVKGRLTPDDEVRRGPDGKWSPAGAVAGLFPKADSSAAWADTAEIPVEAAKKATPAKPVAKGKPAAARAVKPLDLPVAKAAPQPPAADIPVAMPIAMPVNAAPRPAAVVAPAANPMPVAVSTGRLSGRIGKRVDADLDDPKQRKIQKQKTLVIGLAALIGLLAIIGIVGVIVRANSSGTPSAAADGDAKTVAKKTPAASTEPTEDFTGSRTERSASANPGVAKTAAESLKPDPAKPSPTEKPAKASDDAWHDAGGDAVALGDVSLKIPAVTLKTVTANRIRGKEVIGQVVIERLFIKVELRNAPSAKAVPYASWRLPKPGNLPTMTDNGGKNFDYRPSPTPAPAESIEPDKAIEEVLVFQRPTESRKLEFLQLRLPATAFGGQGTVNFKIPAAMIEPEPDKENPGTRPKSKDDVPDLGDTPEQPRTPEKESTTIKKPPPKKDPTDRSPRDLDEDIEAVGGGDKSRT